MEASKVKDLARDNWPKILHDITDLDETLFDGKHHPCPKCGGRDRFRMFDIPEGAVICNQCFTKCNSDGLSTVMWLCDCSFREALRLVAECDTACISQVVERKVLPRVENKRRTVWYTHQRALSVLTNKYGEPSMIWAYHAADLSLEGLVVRWDKNGHKEIRPISRIKGGWVIGGMREPRPLYRLPALLECKDAVYVCEGEKAACACTRLGLFGTTSSGGSNAVDLTDWGPLGGRDVVILPDNDKSGEKYAAKVADKLDGVARRVTVVKLPGLPEGGDVVDWIKLRQPDSPETHKAALESMRWRAVERERQEWQLQ